MPYIGNNHIAGDHTNNFKVLDDISSYTATFDGSATSVVDTTNNTIRVVEHRFIQGQRVTYTNGSGGNIGGLTTGTAYFVIFDGASTFKLATSASNAASSTAINLSAVGTGSSHTLNAAFDGVNTKFKITYNSGTGARFNNATQLNIAINNVLQKPNVNSTTFTEGFAIEDNHKIVFKVAPTSEDIFWGSIIANTLTTFDISDHKIDTFTGDGSTTEFNLSHTPANNESLMVTINGVLQHPSNASTARAYTLIANVIQFTSAPGVGDEIQVRHMGFAGATTADVSGFYGRTGNVVLTDQDDIIVNKISVGTGATIESNGQATFVGVVTFGSSSTTIEGDNNLIKVGTALTLGHTQGLQFHTQNLHSAGFEINQINASGIITASSLDVSGNAFIGGVLTYEDVTSIDAVGLITARNGIDCNGDIDVDGHTNLDNVSIAGVTTVANDTYFTFGSNADANRTLRIKHNSSNTRNEYRSNFQDFYTSDLRIHNISNNAHYAYFWSNQISLFANGSERLQVLGSGAKVFGNLELSSTYPSLTWTDTNHDSDFRITNNDGTLIVYDITRSAHVLDFKPTGDLHVRNDKGIYFGESNDLLIGHDGSSTRIEDSYGFLAIKSNALELQTYTGGEVYAKFTRNGAVELRYDNAVKLTTENTGVNITGIVTATSADINGDLDVDGHTNLDNVSIAGVTTTSGNLIANHSNGQIVLQASDGSIEITKTAGGAYIDFKNSTSEDYDCRINEEGGNFRVNTHFRLYDNKALELGNRTSSTYGDLRLYHDTSNSYIENHTGQLLINNSGGNISIKATDSNADFILRVGGSTSSENAIVAVHHGEVVLSCNGATKLTTTTTGITVTGNISATGGQLTLEDGNEEQIHRFWTSGTDSDINTLLQLYTSSSTFGTIVEGSPNGHHVIALRDNDNADSFAIVSGGGNYMTDTTYDKIIARFKADGKIIFGGNTTSENVTLEILPGGTAGNYSQLVLGRTSSAPTVQTTAVVKGGDAISGVPGIIFGSSNTNLPCVSVETPNSSNGHIVFKPKGTEKVRIDDGGTVVIGDSSSATPTGVLHLYQASNDPYLVIQRGAGDTGIDLGGYYIRNNTNTQIMMKAYQSNINTANLHFYTNHGGSFADRFLMESIGTLKLQSGNTEEKLILQGSGNPYIRFRESTTNKAYIGWSSSGHFFLNNQEDGSVLRIKDGLDFSKDGSTFYNIAHTGNYISHGDNYTHYFVGTNTSTQSTIDTEKVRFYKVSIDGVSNYGGVNHVDIVRAGVHDNNGIHGMWVGSMDVRIKIRFSNCGNGSNYSRIVHNYHSNTSSVTQGQGGGNIARIADYLACTESGRLYVWLRGQLSYAIRVNGRPANIYAIDMSDYRTSMHSSIMPAGFDGEGRDALSIYWGYQGQTGAGRKLYGNSGGIEAQGNVSATGSKPFKIPHPLVGLSTTKNLVHAAIEGPQCDNIYRGKTTLVAGISTVNIDTNANMTEGTFATLNRDVQCFTTNETGWTPIKGSVSGNQLTILAQDNSCTDTISWLVVGERQDDNIVNNTMTDSEGHLIVEPDFEEITEPDNPGEFAAGSSQIGEDGSDRTFTQPLSQ